jgi:hypothetical protein
MFSKLLNVTKKNIEEQKKEIKQNRTFRALATMRIKMDLRRQGANVSSYKEKFEIEFRAD